MTVEELLARCKVVKVLFRTSNRTGCRFLIVDALNRTETLHYYEKNDFRYLIADERLEAKYMGIGVGRLPLNTRLMYFDLLKIKVTEELDSYKHNTMLQGFMPYREPLNNASTAKRMTDCLAIPINKLQK